MRKSESKKRMRRGDWSALNRLEKLAEPEEVVAASWEKQERPVDPFRRDLSSLVCAFREMRTSRISDISQLSKQELFRGRGLLQSEAVPVKLALSTPRAAKRRLVMPLNVLSRGYVLLPSSLTQTRKARPKLKATLRMTTRTRKTSTRDHGKTSISLILRATVQMTKIWKTPSPWLPTQVL